MDHKTLFCRFAEHFYDYL